MEERNLERLDPRELEVHRPWLRKLALAILRDADQAEDCVQDVFLTALRDGPARRPSAASVRAWLKRVLVNRARKSIDREARRRYHESLALAEHAPFHAREPLELRELQVELHRGVLSLEERYRDVVLLRHAQDLLPSEIAERLRVPTKTVNSWLYRAYGKLRERLEGRFEGGLRGWLPVLAGAPEILAPHGEPRPESRRRGSTTPDRPSARGLRWTAAAGTLVAVGSAFLFLFGARSSDASSELAAAAPTPASVSVEPRAEPVGVRAPLAPESARSAVSAVEPAPPVPPSLAPRAAEAARWSGRVVDADGAPVPGLRLHFEPLGPSDLLLFADRESAGYEELLQRVGRSFEPQLGDVADDEQPGAAPGNGDAPAIRSARDGSFTLPAPESLGWIAPDSGRWSTVATAVTLELPPAADALVQVAPARRIAGRVLDAHGLPLRSVRVEFRLPARFLAAESGAPTTLAHEPSLFTGDDGGFVFERVPDLADATLRFRLSGYEPAEQRLERCQGARPAREELEVVLLAEAPELVIAGRAIDARGAPVAGAFLSLDWSSTAQSDDQGRFRLRLPAAPAANDASRAGTLRAAARGFQPLQRTLTRSGERWPEVELVFDAEALVLEGVVLRADGTPHPHAALWVPAPTTLAVPAGNRPPIFAEHVMGGPQDGGSLEATVTDAEGFFRLRGLQDRPYVLRVADLDTREWFATEAIRAGQSDVLLEFPPEGCFPEVHGVVVGSDGAPIPDARVARSYPRLDVRLPDGRRYVSRFAGELEPVDPDGRFRLTSVARHGGLLTVLGPTIETRHVELERERDPTDLRIVVGRTCRVVIERGATACERFSFRSADGGDVEFTTAVRGVAATLGDAPLTDERSAEYLVTDLAAELVLWSGTRAVAHLPLALVAGELNVLRP